MTEKEEKELERQVKFWKKHYWGMFIAWVILIIFFLIQITL